MKHGFRISLTGMIIGCLTASVLSGMLGQMEAARAAVAPARTAALSLSGPVHFLSPAGPRTPTTATTTPSTNLTYHGGMLMPSSRTYAIFWLPAGRHFEGPAAGAAGDTRYRNLITRYLRDVGSTPFYNLLTQYSQAGQPISNISTFGGAFVDTRPYVHSGPQPAGFSGIVGSRTNPLIDNYADRTVMGDIRAEVAHAMAVNGWTSGLTHEFFVFTVAGVQSCWDGSRKDCSIGSDAGYCAYHSAFNLFGSDLNHLTDGTIYGNIPDGYSLHLVPPDNKITCGVQTPNGDPYADATISALSHEQFESVSDPVPFTGWVDDATKSKDGGEIGDKCAYNYGPAVPFYTQQYRNTPSLWLHGNPYTIQMMWSNTITACGYSFCPVTRVCSTRIPPLTMAAGPALIAGQSSDDVKYTITARNLSNVDPATKLAFITALPAGFAYVPHSANADPTKVSTNAVTHVQTLEWDFKAFNVNSSAQLTFHAQHTATLTHASIWKAVTTLHYANSIGVLQTPSIGSISITVQ